MFGFVYIQEFANTKTKKGMMLYIVLDGCKIGERKILFLIYKKGRKLFIYFQTITKKKIPLKSKQTKYV